MVPAFERRLSHHQQMQRETEMQTEMETEMEGEGGVTLQVVCEGVRAGSVTPFHISHFPVGHNPTDYERCVPYPTL